MFAALVIAGLCWAITSLTSGPAVVTHDRTPGQVIVSPLLSNITADRRLLITNTAGRTFQPCRRRSPAAVIVALLLLLGGVETNPDPPSAITAIRPTTSFGVLNARSARHKAALIHDVIADHRLDVLALMETWIPSDAPDAVKLDVAPPGYSAVHHHRGPSSGRRGGGVALVYRDSVKCTPVDIGQYVQFEYLAVKIIGRQSSAVVVCVYRPPDGLASTFLSELADMFDQLTLMNSQFVIVGDFNAPGPTAGQIDPV